MNVNDQKGGPSLYESLPIQTQRLVIRRMTADDLEPIYKLHSDPEVMRYVGKGDVWSRAFTEQIIGPISSNSNNHPLDWVPLTDRASGKFIGVVCILRLPELHRVKIGGGPYHEIGWRILWEHWNNGYATEAAESILQCWFEKLSMPEITCIIDERNTRSVRVAEKLGFRHLRTYDLDTRHIRFNWMNREMFNARTDRLKPHAV